MGNHVHRAIGINAKENIGMQSGHPGVSLAQSYWFCPQGLRQIARAQNESACSN
jgi:hypothetical protein